MPDIPAQCGNLVCRAIYPSGVFLGDGVKRATLLHNRSRCPVCGSWGNVANGVFSVTNDIIEVIAGPEVTAEMIAAFFNIAKKVAASQMSQREAEAATTDIDARFGPILAMFAAHGWPALALLVSMLALAMQYQDRRGSEEFEKLLLNAVMEKGYRSGGDVLVEPKLEAESTRYDDKKRANSAKLKTRTKKFVPLVKSERRRQAAAEQRKALRGRLHKFGRSRSR